MAIELPAQDTDAALASLQAHPAVQRVDDDPVVTIQGAGSDGAGSDGAGSDRVVYVIPALSAPVIEFYPWGVDWIGAADVQGENPGLAGGGVKVALIGTGVDPTHPDLKDNIVGGYNAIAGQEPNNWADDNGHDTHVAGILAARRNNQGVIGVAPRVLIYVFKALDKNGKGHTSDVVNALQHLPPDIRLIHGSFGTDIEWSFFQPVIDSLYQAGKLMVFSAGNRCSSTTAQGAGSDGAGSDAGCVSNPPDVKFPARYHGVIAVGASDMNDQVPDWSRSGSAMADHGVVAPGVNIFSDNWTTGGSGYGWMSGTSPAAPHVTGAVALALQVQRDLSYEDVLALLKLTSKKIPGAPPEQQGVGRINVEALVNLLKSKSK